MCITLFRFAPICPIYPFALLPPLWFTSLMLAQAGTTRQGRSLRVGFFLAPVLAQGSCSRSANRERVIMSNSILVAPRTARVTRQTRYALAGSGVRHKPSPVTITYPDGRVLIMEPTPTRKRKGRKHKPARVAKVAPVVDTPASVSLFDSEFRERLAGLGGYAPESYL